MSELTAAGGRFQVAGGRFRAAGGRRRLLDDGVRGLDGRLEAIEQRTAGIETLLLASLLAVLLVSGGIATALPAAAMQAGAGHDSLDAAAAEAGGGATAPATTAGSSALGSEWPGYDAASWATTRATTAAVSAPAGLSVLVDHSVGQLVTAGTDLPAVRPPLWLVVVGYTRHDELDPLENDARKRVFEAVSAAPGTYIAGIVDRTDIPRSTVRYHLRVLEREGLVAGETIGGKHRYAPADADLALEAALEDGPTAAVLEAVARFEPVSVGGLADELDRAPSTVSHHLDRLADDGLVERERDGRRVLVSLSPRASDYFEAVPEGAAGETAAGLPVE